MKIQPPVTRPLNMDALLQSVGIGIVSTTYQPSDVISFQGDAADSVFFLQDGLVKLSVASSEGRGGVVALLESGDFFGESALAGQRTRRQEAMAVTPATVLIIPKAQMIRALHTDHAFSDRFITHMLARNTRLEADLVDQLLNSSEKRLARTLLLLAHCGKPGETHHVLPKVSQTTLAEIVGTTRSRVNYFMSGFKRRGFIEDDGGLRINDSLMTVLAENEAADALRLRAS